jgi:hypothetical protein
MPPQSQNGPESLAFLKEPNLAYFFHDRLSPVVEEIRGVNSFSEKRANFVSAELLEAFLWVHLGLRVNYFPLELARRLTYEHMHFFLRAYERILAGRLMESWITQPFRSIWESEFSGRQELFSSGQRWDDSGISQGLASAFQSLFVLANGFAQSSKARELLLTMVVATDSEWNRAIQNNKPLETAERMDSAAGASAPQLHWSHPGFFEVLDYMRAFRRADADVRQMLEDSRPMNIFPETQQYVYLLREVQQWRLNFGDTVFHGRFLKVARLAAETFTNLAGDEKGHEAQRAAEEFVKELYPLMTDWGAPQAATA